MALIGRLAVLAGAAEAARRYARDNPEKTDRYLSKAADFANQRTKGKYTRQITSATSKARQLAAGQGGTPQQPEQPGPSPLAPGTGQVPPPPPPPPVHPAG